jgi:hypothetical protein
MEKQIQPVEEEEEADLPASRFTWHHQVEPTAINLQVSTLRLLFFPPFFLPAQHPAGLFFFLLLPLRYLSPGRLLKARAHTGLRPFALNNSVPLFLRRRREVGRHCFLFNRTYIRATVNRPSPGPKPFRLPATTYQHVFLLFLQSHFHFLHQARHIAVLVKHSHAMPI